MRDGLGDFVLDTNDSCNLGGKWESDQPKTLGFSLEGPLEKNFLPPDSTYESLADMFDDSEHQWSEEVNLASKAHSVMLSHKD